MRKYLGKEMSDLQRKRSCSYLLPDPGGGVVRDLIDELEAERETVRWCVESGMRIVRPGKIFPVELHFTDVNGKFQWVEIVDGDVREGVEVAKHWKGE